MGGQAGMRGYLIQTLICVLSSLKDKNWEFLSDGFGGIAPPKTYNPYELGAIARKCHNKLVIACDNPEVIQLFRKIIGLDGQFNFGLVVDFRAAIRNEPGFGENQVDVDRSSAWISTIGIKVNVDAEQQWEWLKVLKPNIKRIVDFGCGADIPKAGESNLLELEALAWALEPDEIVVVDKEITYLQNAKANLDWLQRDNPTCLDRYQIQFVQADMTESPLLSGYFDLVYCERVFQDIIEDDQARTILAVQETVRVVKPGGCIIVVMYNHDWNEVNEVESLFAQTNGLERKKDMQVPIPNLEALVYKKLIESV